MALAKLSTAALQAELERRAKSVGKLQKKRDALVAELNELDKQLAELGGASAGRSRRGKAGRPAKAAGSTSRKRPKNAVTLSQALADAADLGAVLSPLEAAEIVQKNGYKTSSATFNVQVATALAKHPQFKKVGRGQYERVK